MGCFVRGGKNGMGCFVRGDKNCMGCFVWGGKLMRDVLSGVAKNGMGCFVRDVLSYIHKVHLSYDIASGSGITSCIKIDKPLVVYRFSGNIMTAIATLRT